MRICLLIEDTAITSFPSMAEAKHHVIQALDDEKAAMRAEMGIVPSNISLQFLHETAGVIEVCRVQRHVCNVDQNAIIIEVNA